MRGRVFLADIACSTVPTEIFSYKLTFNFARWLATHMIGEHQRFEQCIHHHGSSALPKQFSLHQLLYKSVEPTEKRVRLLYLVVLRLCPSRYFTINKFVSSFFNFPCQRLLYLLCTLVQESNYIQYPVRTINIKSQEDLFLEK